MHKFSICRFCMRCLFVPDYSLISSDEFGMKVPSIAELILLLEKQSMLLLCRWIHSPLLIIMHLKLALITWGKAWIQEGVCWTGKKISRSLQNPRNITTRSKGFESAWFHWVVLIRSLKTWQQTRKRASAIAHSILVIYADKHCLAQ